MDEKEIARIVAEANHDDPRAYGIVLGWNMVIISRTSGAVFEHADKLRVREALIEAERRTCAQLGMVRFL